MNRRQFEMAVDAFIAERSVLYTHLGLNEVRDFIWEKLLGRSKTVRKDCKHCGINFPLSRGDQVFHSPACKAAYFQEQRRKREKGKKDYET